MRQKSDAEVGQVPEGGSQDVVACCHAVLEYLVRASGIDFHIVEDCCGEEAGIGSAGTEVESLRQMAGADRYDRWVPEVGHGERGLADHSENEAVDLGHFESEAGGLGTGEKHANTEVENSAGQKAGIAGAERRVDY